VRVAVTPVP